MEIAAHRLVDAAQVDSPNFNARPHGEISLIVIHGISLPPGEFGGPMIEALFTNSLDPGQTDLAELASMRVSSHLLIRRDAQLIQFVPFDARAWHAGVSSFNGRSDCNDFSVGVELEGTDELPYTDAQYGVLAQVCRTLMNMYGVRDIVGHSDIAPGRKTDPGPAFDWFRLKRGIAAS